jgi:hypothetical protein
MRLGDSAHSDRINKTLFCSREMSQNFSHYSRQTDFYSVIKTNVEIFSLIATEFNFISFPQNVVKLFLRLAFVVNFPNLR